MSKTELKAELERKGLLNTNGSRDALWIKAFEEYNKVHSPKLVISSCGTCYNMVRQWLNS